MYGKYSFVLFIHILCCLVKICCYVFFAEVGMWAGLSNINQ